MRMSKVAVVLLVLASFVAASTVVSMAAMATPTMKPMATSMQSMRPLPKEMTMMPNSTTGMQAKNVPAATAMPNTTVGKAPAQAPATSGSQMGKPAVPAAPAVPNATMKAPAMPAVKKMFDLTPMKSTIGNVYKMLKKTTKMPGKSSGTGAGVKSKASKMLSGTMGQMSSGKGQSTQLSVPAPRALSQLGGMPKMAM